MKYNLLLILALLSSGETTYYYVDDFTQPSVVTEKFPLLRIVTSSEFDNWEYVITNLGYLGSSEMRQRIDGRDKILFVYGWLDQTVEYINGLADVKWKNPFESMSNANYYGGVKTNLITVNWTAYNQGDFLTVVNRLQPIANEVGDQLYNMATDSSDPMNLSEWRFVGFSLGAHMVGLIARRIKERSNGKIIIPRVTGLDPAGPLLNYPITSCIFPHLDKSDAKFVDVIHTNAGGFGSGWHIGHIDFWPNFGTNQPGCPKNNDLDFIFRPKNLCSHLLSVLFYATQLYYDLNSWGPTYYAAVRCKKDFFKKLQCTNDIAYMGYRLDANAPEGDYYLITKDRYAITNGGLEGVAPFLKNFSASGGEYSFS